MKSILTIIVAVQVQRDTASMAVTADAKISRRGQEPNEGPLLPPSPALNTNQKEAYDKLCKLAKKKHKFDVGGKDKPYKGIIQTYVIASDESSIASFKALKALPDDLADLLQKARGQKDAGKKSNGSPDMPQIPDFTDAELDAPVITDFMAGAKFKGHVGDLHVPYSESLKDLIWTKIATGLRDLPSTAAEHNQVLHEYFGALMKVLMVDLPGLKAKLSREWYGNLTGLDTFDLTGFDAVWDSFWKEYGDQFYNDAMAEISEFKQAYFKKCDTEGPSTENTIGSKSEFDLMDAMTDEDRIAMYGQ